MENSSNSKKNGNTNVIAIASDQMVTVGVMFVQF